MMTTRTQKAKGIVTLKNAGWSMPNFTIVQTPEEAAKQFSGFSDPVFARPCPERPRHGFVDSRAVKSTLEASKLMQETLTADPKGEMILMSKIDASHNIVWRPGLLAIGPGHDGATAGSQSLSIPVLPTCNDAMMSLAEKASVAKGDVPYVEAVIRKDDGKIKYTQLRGGPSVSTMSGDFIPKDITVKFVEHADGDLLAWEKKAAAFKAGTVVYHPGGNLGSHYSVHCILHNIPVIIEGKKPKVGDKLKAKTKIDPLDPEMLIDGITSVFAYNIMWKEQKDITTGKSLAKAQFGTKYVSAILTGLHHSGAMMSAANVWYVGVAVGMMLRLGTAAALGELRHKKTKASGHFYSGITKLSRDQVFVKAFSQPFESRMMLREAYRSFKNDNWVGSYGGKKWAACTAAVGALDEAVYALIQDPRAEHATAVVSALNTAVNQAHNNGWWMNKFCSSSLFDDAASGDPRVACNAAPLFFEITNNVTLAADLKCLAKWQKAEKLDLEKHAVPKDQAAICAELGFQLTDVGRSTWVKYTDGVYYEYKIVGFRVHATKPIVTYSIDDGPAGGIYHFAVKEVLDGFNYKESVNA